MTLAENIAQVALEIGAIQINARKPFTWASGYKMPIYNDNRLLLGNAEHRALIAKGFQDLLKKCAAEVEVIAGTATAGIPHATTLADLLQVARRAKPWHHASASPQSMSVYVSHAAGD